MNNSDYFQVGKLYEWKRKNSFHFHLYDKSEKFIYNNTKVRLAPGEIVFILEVVPLAEISFVRMMTPTGIIGWGQIYHIHTESLWKKL